MAPYLQRALIEMLLLAVPAGLLGTWIVLRRLAFFTHAVGTVSFPGLVLASAWGIAPSSWRRSRARLGFGVLQERDHAPPARPRPRPPPRDCCWSAHWPPGSCSPPTCSHPERASRPAPVRDPADRPERARRLGSPPPSPRERRSVLDGHAAARLAHRCSSPSSARALGLRTARGPSGCLLAGIAAAAVRGALDAVGALLVTVVLVIPAATARLLSPPPSATLRRRPATALAAAEGRDRRVRRRQPQRQRRARRRRARRRGVRRRGALRHTSQVPGRRRHGPGSEPCAGSRAADARWSGRPPSAEVGFARRSGQRSSPGRSQRRRQDDVVPAAARRAGAPAAAR